MNKSWGVLLLLKRGVLTKSLKFKDDDETSFLWSQEQGR